MADHTKLLTFDRQVALLGGMNVGREYFSEWHDLMVRIEGPAVASLQHEFDMAWAKAGPWGDFSRMPEAVEPVDGRGLRLLRTDAAAGRVDILKATIAAIRASRRRVWIENPYFSSDEVLRAAAAAARRGVDVRVVLPSRNDSTIMDVNHLSAAQDLIQAGARVYRYPGMSHLKAMICDDWATLGSANLDTLSLRINRELNIAFRRPDEVRELADRVFVPDFRKSRLLRLEETSSPVAPLAESIADQL
jgi:cardiolipin synthase